MSITDRLATYLWARDLKPLHTCDVWELARAMIGMIKDAGLVVSGPITEQTAETVGAIVTELEREGVAG